MAWIDCSSGHDLMVLFVDLGPHLGLSAVSVVGLSAVSVEPASDPLSPSLSLPLPCSLSLSLSP